MMFTYAELEPIEPIGIQLEACNAGSDVMNLKFYLRVTFCCRRQLLSKLNVPCI